MEKVYKQLGNRIREIRKKKSLTLEELSDRAELDWSFLARIETGKGIPSINTLIKISKALDISLSDLFALASPKEEMLLNRRILSLLQELKTSEKHQIIKLLKILLS